MRIPPCQMQEIRPHRQAQICPIWQNEYSYHFETGECYEARHKLQVTLSNWRVISSAGVSGAKRKGLPISTLSSPLRAILRLDIFMSKSPSMRSGTTGTSSFCANIPTPERKGDGRPSCVRRPSGNTTTLYPRSTDSPAKAKLSRTPDCCGSGNT